MSSDESISSHTSTLSSCSMVGDDNMLQFYYSKDDGVCDGDVIDKHSLSKLQQCPLKIEKVAQKTRVTIDTNDENDHRGSRAPSSVQQNDDEEWNEENNEGMMKNSTLPQPINSCAIHNGDYETNLDHNPQHSRTRLNDDNTTASISSNEFHKNFPMMVKILSKLAKNEEDVDWNKYDIICETMHYVRHIDWKKRVFGIIYLTISIYVVVDVIFFDNLKSLLYGFIQWMSSNMVIGTLAFSMLYVVTTLVFIPSSIMTFGGSFVYANVCGFVPGIILSIVLSFVCSCIGGTIAFLQSRYMTRELVLIYTNRFKFLGALDNVLEKRGIRVLMLLRLSPFIPFTAINYVAGATGVTFQTFLKSMIGIVPMLITMVIMGATASNSIMPAVAFSLKKEQTGEVSTFNMIHILILAISIALGITATIILWYMTKLELTKVINDADENLSTKFEGADSIEKNSISTIFTKTSGGTTRAGSTTSSTDSKDDSFVGIW